MTPPLDERALEEAATEVRDASFRLEDVDSGWAMLSPREAAQIARAAVTAYLGALPSAGREDGGGSA